MEHKTHKTEHQRCNNCTNNSHQTFKHIEIHKGTKFSLNNDISYIIIFILSGELSASYMDNQNTVFQKGEICIWPVDVKCIWESTTDTSCIFLDIEKSKCSYNKDRHIQTYSETGVQIPFKQLYIKPILMDFLLSVKKYLVDNIKCPEIQNVKLMELSLLLRAYYSSNELLAFFLPTNPISDKFEEFIMDNYLKVKGVKEFVYLSGMNIATFNRKFKSHFNESPYKWLIKKRSSHIYQALSTTTKTLAMIAKEFYFSDASHLSRYCKETFGESPSKIRRKTVVDKIESSTLILNKS